MAHYRGGWEVGGGLNSPLGLFGLLAMGPEVPAINPNMLEWR